MMTKQATTSIEKAAMAMARNAEASAEQLAPLAGISQTIDRLLASHAHAGADLLEKLAHSSDRATRKRVVLNANTPKETLVRLAPQFPGDFFRNPVFDWLLLEEPDLLTRIGGGVLKNILKRPDCPQSFLNWAVAHGNEEEKLAVAMNPEAPADVIRILVSGGGKVADAAMCHSSIAAASGDDPEIVFMEALRSAIADADKVPTLAQWPALGPDSRLRDAMGFEGLRAISRHPATPRDQWLKVWSVLAGSSNSSIRCAVAENPAAPVEMLSVLAGDKDKWVRLRVARNSSTPVDLLTQLALKQDLDRWGVAQNPSTPVELLTLLARDQDGEVRSEVVRNPSAPVELLTLLAEDQDGNVLISLAENPATPAEVLTRLAGDHDEYVRTIVAENPAAPGEVLSVLSGDKNQDVREAVAGNRATPAEVLTRLAGDHDEYVRKIVAENPAAPGEVLSVLSGDKNQDVREAVAGNPATPIEVLSLLAGDEDRFVQRAVAGNPVTPTEVLSKLFRSRAKSCFRAIAEHPNCSPEWLDRLAKEKLDVRLAASKRISRERWQAAWMEALDTGYEVAMDRLHSAVTNDLPTEIVEALWRELDCLISAPRTSKYWAWRCRKLRNAELADACRNEDLLHLDDRKAEKASRSSDLIVRLLGLSHRLAAPDVLANRSKSVEWVERLAVAHNPNTPPNIIETLKKDPNRRVARQAEATARLKAEAIDRQFRMLQEGDTKLADSALIEEISQRLKLRYWLPGSILTSRWAEFLPLGQWIDQIGLDPAWLTQILPEDLTQELARYWLDSDGKFRKEAEGIGSLTLPTTLAWLAEQAVPLAVLKRIAENTNTPVSTLGKLAGHKNRDVRDAVAKHPATPVEVLTRLAGDKDEWVRRNVARNPSTPVEMLPLLAGDKDGEVRSIVADHPATPAEVLTVLARDQDFEVRRAVTRNPSTPVDVLTLLAGDQDQNVRCAAAARPAMPVDVLTLLAEDQEASVRYSVAENSATPVGVLTLLATDRDWAARSAVAGNLATPLEVLTVLPRDRETHLLWAYTKNLAIPMELLTVLAGDKDEYARLVAAKNPATPVDVLAVLARDQDRSVRNAVGANPTTPADVLATLAADQERNVRSAAAKNSATPAEVLSVLAGDRDKYVRSEVGRNSATPVETLTLLARDLETNVRMAIAENPAIPVALLSTLASDVTLHPFWRLRYVQHPNFSRSAAESVIKDCINGLRTRLSIPRPSITTMTDDEFIVAFKALGVMPAEDDKKAAATAAKSKDWLTRAAATYVKEIQPSLLKALLEDPVHAVRQRAVFRLRSGEQDDAA